MKKIGAVLGAVACFAAGSVRGQEFPRPLTVPRYETRCVIVDPATVEGFVTNTGPVLIKVVGPVRFIFILANSMSRPSVQAQSSVLIAPGRTSSVGRAQLGGNILPSEVCRLDISEAVR